MQVSLQRSAAAAAAAAAAVAEAKTSSHQRYWEHLPIYDALEGPNRPRQGYCRNLNSSDILDIAVASDTSNVPQYDISNHVGV